MNDTMTDSLKDGSILGMGGSSLWEYLGHFQDQVYLALRERGDHVCPLVSICFPTSISMIFYF